MLALPQREWLRRLINGELMKKNSGGSAFPAEIVKGYNLSNSAPIKEPTPGMTLRDYFASKALAGLLANPATKIEDNDGIRSLAEISFDLADAMIAASSRDS